MTRSSGLTLGEVINQYIERHVKQKRTHPDHPTRGVKDVEGQRDRCLKHLLDRKVASIRRAEILDLREAVKEKRGPEAANRLIQVLRAAVNWSIHQAELWRGPNPAENIKMFPKQPRRRWLNENELPALRDALAKTQNRDLKDFVMLALMTGARKSDITSMAWSDLELDRGTWLVPEPKNQTPYYVTLTRAAVDILRARREFVGDGKWVFPSATSECGHILDMKRAWATLLDDAKITDLHQHDLRRTLGSWQATGGASLLVIGKSLGHKSTAATQIYAQMQLDPVRASVEAATAAMFANKPEPKQLPAATAGKKEVRR